MESNVIYETEVSRKKQELAVLEREARKARAIQVATKFGYLYGLEIDDTRKVIGVTPDERIIVKSFRGNFCYHIEDLMDSFEIVRTEYENNKLNQTER